MEEENRMAEQQQQQPGVVLTPQTAQQTAGKIQGTSGSVPSTSQEENKPAESPTPVGAAPVGATPSPPKPSFTVRSMTEVRDRYLNMLIYGPYGVGKTTLACSAAYVREMGDVILGNVEAGDMPVEGWDLDAADITNYTQFARMHDYLRVHCELRDKNDLEGLAKTEIFFKGLGLPFEDEEMEALRQEKVAAIKKHPRKYRTVVIDSLSEVQKLCMYQLLGIKVGIQALDIEPDTPQFAEWGKSAEMIRLLVRTYRNLKMHSIFVCGRGEEQDEFKRFHFKPALPGKLANEVQGFLDVVGYYVGAPLEGGEMVRRLYVAPGTTYAAKHRFRNFKGVFLENPTMQDIYNLSRGVSPTAQ